MLFVGEEAPGTVVLPPLLLFDNWANRDKDIFFPAPPLETKVFFGFARIGVETGHGGLLSSGARRL